MTTTQAFISIAVIAIATFLTRAIPFLLFPSDKAPPEYIRYLGKVLPYAVIGMLIVYCLKSVNLTAFPHGAPEAIAIAFVVIVHKWKHNLLLSILGGTVLYMIFIRILI